MPNITTAVVAAKNENVLALANLNFDFSLVKLEAPIEFRGLGNTIAKRRKIDAEEGALHKTARRLGALFKDMLPHTDDLFRAYGTRTSEISSSPSINPQASERSAIFATHIGADTTSIWAAATSGSAAIAVHLLACMLARMFSGPEAVSLWVELVQKQKACISSNQDKALFSAEQIPAIVAAYQDISRSDLASWDSSARAWLQSADEAKALQHKQTMLILGSASIPVNSNPDPYDSVMKAWTTGLTAMDNLVKGMPQRVHDGAALLAMSSWHLYPNMLVYAGSCVEVDQKDPIFDQNALLTLGLEEAQARRGGCKGVYWSLPLSRLQYYGDPVQAHRSVGQENSRITSKQFAYVVLGCTFDAWKKYAPTNDEGLLWMDMLGEILGTDYLRRITWLHHLVVAARELVECEGLEKQAANQLMNLGRRRSTFLTPPGKALLPLFGLSDVDVLLPLLWNDELRVQYLRRHCLNLGLKAPWFLVKYRTSAERLVEYASIGSVAGKRCATKRTFTGDPAQTKPNKHVRWVCLSVERLQLCVRRAHNIRDLPGSCKKLKSLTSSLDDLTSTDIGGESAPVIDNMTREIKELEDIISISKRMQFVEKLKEFYLPCAENLREDPQGQGALNVSNDRQRDTGITFSEETEFDFIDACKQLLGTMKSPNRRITHPTLFAGNEKVAALVSINKSCAKQAPDFVLGPKDVEEIFNPLNISREKLMAYLRALQQAATGDVRSLRLCAVVGDTYRHLPGGTISTQVMRQAIHRAKWAPKLGGEYSIHEDNNLDEDNHSLLGDTTALTLPQSFALVAMFESGICNLDPEALSQVFAMSSGNSLYIAGELLCDPYERRTAGQIQRAVGNIGRAGITFLIYPPEVKFKEADPEKWMLINHNVFDGKLEDHFKESSIHLSFTEYEIPLAVEAKGRHVIDHDFVLVESILSIYDGSLWVGELDVSTAFSSNNFELIYEYHCEDSDHQKRSIYREAPGTNLQPVATSIENWDELIETPETGAIAIRAHENSLARLATTVVCEKKGFTPIILSKAPCWTCCSNLMLRNSSRRIALIC
jgi:hypothetical protein